MQGGFFCVILFSPAGIISYIQQIKEFFMGLDIMLYAIEDKEKGDYIALHDISRSFCSLVRSLAEEAENCELKQIAAIAHTDISVFQKMTTWKLWQQQYGGFARKEEEEKFIRDYNKACDDSWQDINSVIKCIENLHDSLAKIPSFENRINYTLDWLLAHEYFLNFDKNVLFKNYATHKNFGWDLRSMLEFLKSMKANKMKFTRFHLS